MGLRWGFQPPSTIGLIIVSLQSSKQRIVMLNIENQDHFQVIPVKTVKHSFASSFISVSHMNKTIIIKVYRQM